MNQWSRLFRRQKRDEELDEEVQGHLQMAVQERMERGESAEQAHSSALREFGNVGLIKEMTRDTWGFRWLTTKGRLQLAVETGKWGKLAGAIARILMPAEQEGKL